MLKGVLKHTLTDRPQASDFQIIEGERPTCPPDGMVIKTAYISLDPFVGSRIRGLHMGEPVPVPGEDSIFAYAVGQVVESRVSNFSEGDWVHSINASWQTYCAVPASSAHKIDVSNISPSLYLSSLGMPGLTAWAGVTQRLGVGSGDVFSVNAAAGAVGGCAGQIARLHGAETVIGIAGGAQKCAIVKDAYGFDIAIDYKQAGWEDQFAKATNNQLTAHFENVGVDPLNLALSHIKPYGRAVICGLVDQYHAAEKPPGVTPGLIVGKRASIMGLVVYDFFDQWQDYIAQARDWVLSGRLTLKEDVAEGLDAAPAQFEKLMRGQNIGKTLVKIDPEAP